MLAPKWYCCHQLRERAVIAALAPVIVLPPLFAYPKPLWDVLWVGFGLSIEARQAAFLSIYGLEIVTIGDPPEQFLSPLPSFLPFWLEAAAFTLSPAQGCPDGCERFEFQ